MKKIEENQFTLESIGSSEVLILVVPAKNFMIAVSTNSEKMTVWRCNGSGFYRRLQEYPYIETANAGFLTLNEVYDKAVEAAHQYLGNEVGLWGIKVGFKP
ncbi:hypothetical protein [Microbulbifer sp. THAF38]|uniref:hypothetical protein n=1 Tax=Microbulbifer sp. THAF38 TaxID=2587856 RepID=UPI00126969BB|nr:hypothetical protein [Microbulbifer sp. THAF38]QFT56610.1 hypothetical protein FIU95_18845 [Microbulbifer sp. THAF38]